MAFTKGFKKIAEGNGFLGGAMVDSAVAAKKAMPVIPPAPAGTGIMGKAFGSIRKAFAG